MTSAVNFRINSSSCVSEEPLSSECKVIEIFLKDLMSISTPYLMGNKSSGPIVESIALANELILSDKDKDLLLKALANPPKPNKEFIKAYHKFHGSKTNRN